MIRPGTQLATPFLLTTKAHKPFSVSTVLSGTGIEREVLLYLGFLPPEEPFVGFLPSQAQPSGW